MPFIHWTVSQVCEWLQEKHFDETVIQQFRSQGVTGENLARIQREECFANDFAIHISSAKRKRILSLLMEMRKTEPLAPPLVEPMSKDSTLVSLEHHLNGCGIVLKATSLAQDLLSENHASTTAQVRELFSSFRDSLNAVENETLKSLELLSSERNKALELDHSRTSTSQKKCIDLMKKLSTSSSDKSVLEDADQLLHHPPVMSSVYKLSVSSTSVDQLRSALQNFSSSSIVPGSVLLPGYPSTVTGSVIVLGGTNSDDEVLATVELFDSLRRQWIPLAPMSVPRGYYPAAFHVDRRVYVCGGFGGGESYLNSVEFYDLDTEKWESVSPMSHARSHVSGCLLSNGFTFVLTGGFDGQQSLATCEQLDVVSNHWSSFPEMVVKGLSESIVHFRSHHCTVLYKGDIVVLGGFESHRGESLSSVLRYDFSVSEWVTFVPLSSPRYKFGANVIDNKIVIFGGLKDQITASIEVFDGACWSSIDTSLSFPRYAFASVPLFGKLVVLGGLDDEDEAIQDVEIYSIYSENRALPTPLDSMPDLLRERARFVAVFY